MPKIDFSLYDKTDAIEAGSGGDRLPAGGYVAQIQAVRTEWENSRGELCTAEEKEYVKLIFDIVEGDHKGIFRNDANDPSRDWKHWACLSWKNINTDTRRMGMLKGTLTAFTNSNAGFDAPAAFSADRWDLFVGKQIGLVIGEEEYENREGDVAVKTSLPNFHSVQVIRNGEFKVPKLKKLNKDTNTAQTATASTADYYSTPTTGADDVPF